MSGEVDLHDVVIESCPRQRMRLLHEALQEGIRSSAYFTETGELLAFHCAPFSGGFLLCLDRAGTRLSRAHSGELTRELLEEAFFDLHRMHKARPTADAADLEAKLDKVVADIAAGSARSICLDDVRGKTGGWRSRA